MQNMTIGSPLRLIISFSIPLMIGNLFQQIYSLSDIIIVGNLIGTKALAAVGVAAPLFFLMVMVSIGFTNGLTIITAQRFGNRDYKNMRRSAATATIISAMFTLITNGTILLFLDKIFSIMNVPEDLYQDAKIFTSTIGYGVISIVFFNLLSSFMRALGDSKTPLYFLILTSILNIFFNILFIKFFNMGVRGSALGTIVAMSISVACCLVYMSKKFQLLLPQKEDWILKWDFCKKHLNIALPMALQFSVLAISALIIQRVCNLFGSTIIAGFVSAMRIDQLAMQPLITLGIATSTFVAQNYGAKKIARIRKVVRLASIISLALSISIALIVYFWGSDLASIFIKEKDLAIKDEVIKTAKTYLNISVIFYFFLGQLFIFRAAIQGMGNGIIPLFSSIIELAVRAFAATVLAGTWGYIGLCFANPVAWLVASLALVAGYYWKIKKLKKMYSISFRKKRSSC